jgi:hypothetical protein
MLGKSAADRSASAGPAASAVVAGAAMPQTISVNAIAGALWIPDAHGIFI